MNEESISFFVCGPCVAAGAPRPHRISKKSKRLARTTLEAKAFDEKKSTLQRFAVGNKIPWQQYFDGKGTDNAFGGRRFRIEALPSMWLVDQKGNLRDIQADDDLEGSLEKMLAEKP